MFPRSRLSMQNPQRAISALGLLVTCMYTGDFHQRLLNSFPLIFIFIFIFFFFKVRSVTDLVGYTRSLTPWSFLQKTRYSLPWRELQFCLIGNCYRTKHTCTRARTHVLIHNSEHIYSSVVRQESFLSSVGLPRHVAWIPRWLLITTTFTVRCVAS